VRLLAFGALTWGLKRWLGLTDLLLASHRRLGERWGQRADWR
jgi:hypothetical protein